MSEKLYFENSKGDKLVGVLSNPSDDLSVPIIILCHGHSSSKDSKTFTSIEERLNNSGIASFRFDFYGHGESEGYFGDCTISEAACDILNAIDFLKEKGFRPYFKSDGTELKLNYGFYEDFENNNGYEAAEKIKIPTIIVHGDSDETVSIEQSKKTASIIGNCKLEIIEGANHRFTEGNHFDRSIKLLSDFIIDTLK